MHRSTSSFAPARFLCDFLQLGKLASIRIQHYRAGAHQEAEARVTIPLAVDIRGAQLLLVDDVNDSGKTLAAATAHLADFAPAAVRTAVLHEKTSTVQLADYRDSVIREWRWILYPWAVVEDVGQFIRDMQPPPQNLAELRERLAAEGGPPAKIVRADQWLAALKAGRNPIDAAVVQALREE